MADRFSDGSVQWESASPPLTKEVLIRSIRENARTVVASEVTTAMQQFSANPDQEDMTRAQLQAMAHRIANQVVIHPIDEYDGDDLDEWERVATLFDGLNGDRPKG